MKQKHRDIDIYRDYVLAKSDPKLTVISVAKKHGITRNVLYDIVRRIENGNVAQLRRCTEKSRMDCLWEYKYKPRFLAIPRDRKESTVLMLRKLIREMDKDGFKVSHISTRIGKDRSTVLHHLETK